MNRTFTAVAAIAVLATTIATPAASTTTEPDLTTVTVVVAGTVFVPDGVEAPTLPKGRSETLIVTAPAAEIDALVDRRMAEAAQRIESRTTRLGGGATANKENVAYGSCGMSHIRLSASGSQTSGQAYVESGFTLDNVKSAGSYWTTTSVYTSGWSKQLTWSGDLGGALRWSKGTRVTVPTTASYSAGFTAKVTVVRSDGRPGSYASLVKDVTGVQIYVS